MLNNKNKKNGQSFSADILVVVIVLLFGVLFLVSQSISNTNDDSSKLDKLKEMASENSRVIVESFKKKDIIDSENNVAVENLLQLDMDEIKQELNIQGEFCIVFEKDGKLVKLDPESDVNGIGSENIIVNDVPCRSG